MKIQLAVGIILVLLGLAGLAYGINMMATWQQAQPPGTFLDGSGAVGLGVAIVGFIVAFIGAVIGLRAYNNPFD